MQFDFPMETICMKYQNLFPEKKKKFWHFMQIISNGDNLHEMSKVVFREKEKKKTKKR